MVTSRKNVYLIAMLVALLPELTTAAVVGGDYAQAAQQAASQGGGANNGSGSAANAAANATKSPTGTPTSGGNAGAVSSILHPGGGAGSAGSSQNYVPPEPMTNDDTRDIVIVNSINNFTGYCACPYSKNRDGYECGVEAEYYKPGGYRIFCYPEDVRGQLMLYYRKTH